MKSPLSMKMQNEKLLMREKALAEFGTFAFSETNLDKILSEAARVCAKSLGAPFSKVCKFQPPQNDLRVVAGYGWESGVVGYAISVADETSPQGRAFTTGQPQVCSNVEQTNTYILPAFYPEHHVLSTVDVLVATKSGVPFGVLEVDSREDDAFDEHDIVFLTGFANILAEAVATSERADALQKTVARMETLIDEKETLSQELKHRVRNSLHLVYGLLSSEVGAVHDKDSLIAFRSIALRVMGLAEVFDHLLGVGMSKVINFGDYVAALCENLPGLYKDYNVKLTCSVGQVILDLEPATSLGIAITELVSNAYLHAFPEKSGEIDVTMHVALGSGWLAITDNGVGYVDVETKRGLVRRFVEQVGGTMSLRSDRGTPWTINFPVLASDQEAVQHGHL
jgi:two-component sensor histidine kinase